MEHNPSIWHQVEAILSMLHEATPNDINSKLLYTGLLICWSKETLNVCIGETIDQELLCIMCAATVVISRLCSVLLMQKLMLMLS